LALRPWRRGATDERRGIAHALKAGVTPREIMKILKLCVSEVMEACSLAVPILAEELDARSKT
jgi:hypothetical protein